MVNARFDPALGREVPVYVGQWQGQAVDINSILVKYTGAGDVDLSGRINADDYCLIDGASLGAGSGAAPKSYPIADADFDGTTGGDDLSLIASAYYAQARPTAPAAHVALPEPKVWEKRAGRRAPPG